MTKRTVFFISDGTGITAETLGHTLITQFENIQFESVTIPYVDSIEKAIETVNRVNSVYQQQQIKPLVFTTLVNPDIREQLNQSNALILDLFSIFLKPLEKELGEKSSYRMGRSHSVIDINSYKMRIDAVNFALNNDDGAGMQNYQRADVIIVGVSRCGKTPTSLYLALQFGIYVANFPIVETDITKQKIPEDLREHRHKLFGLTIDVEQLHAIRNERRPNSQYASLQQCRVEVSEVESLFRREGIPFLNSTTRSIEELATKILDITGIIRRLY